MAADETTTQDAVCGDPDAELPTRRQDVAFDAARDQRIFNLQVTDRMYGMRAPNRRGSGFREANMFDITRLDHFRHGADRILDRHSGVDAAKTIDINPVRSEPAQRVGKKVLHGRRSAVDAEPVALQGRVARRTSR